MEVVGTSKKVFHYISKPGTMLSEPATMGSKPGTAVSKLSKPGTADEQQQHCKDDAAFGPHQPLKYKSLEGRIELRNVTFAYPSRVDTAVLSNVSFNINKGEVVAVVGPSGSGKSSIINLLQQFYEPNEGTVLVDGIPVSDYQQDYWHREVSAVQQEPVLFARTISENITFGLQHEPTQNEIEHSCKMANIHSFVSSLPQGYATPCGERAVKLSGGQKQRLAIARALVRNPTILLLDEATSALDSESERLIKDSISRNVEGRTVVIVAHRMSTVESADNIVVLNEGRVVEQGNHAHLMERGGVYARLVENQNFTGEVKQRQIDDL